MKNTRFGAIQIAIILLALVTAIIHLALGISFGDTLFILNGVGFLGLLAALYLPQLRAYQGYTRWALMAYAAVTILAWVVVTGFDLSSTLGVITKLIEIALIVFLFLEGRK